MAATQKTYIARKDQDAEFTNLDVSGDLVVTGGLTVSGTVTYTGETNIDDTAGFQLADNTPLILGTDSDVTLKYDNTDLDALPAANNAVWNFGNGTLSFDVKTFGSAAANFLLWDASDNALELNGAARLDFSSVNVAAANTDGGIIKGGTSGARIVEDTADMRFINFNFDNGATSGDNRGMYLRLYLTGAGGGGEAARIFTTVEDVAAGTAHGAHISLNFGATGSVTGQGIAMRGTLQIPNAAMSGGTYAAVQAEIFADGSSSDISGTTVHALFRGVIGGDGTGAATVANFLDLTSVPAAGDGAFINTNASMLASSAYAGLRVLTPAGLKYIKLYDVS